MDKHTKSKPHANFFVHVYQGFQAQPLPTKLFIIGLVILILSIPFLVSPIFVKADGFSLVLNPTDDAYINKSSKNENYNDREIKSDKDRVGFLKFNLTTLGTQTQPILKAELRVYVSSDSKIAHQVKNVPDTSWTEESLKYNNSPVRSPQIIGTILPNKKGKWVTIDITNDVKAHVGNMYSIAIENPAGKSDSFHFYSKEDKNRKPELVIQLSTPQTIPTTAPNVTQIPTVTATTAPTRTPTPVLSVTIGPSKSPTPTRTPTPIAQATIAPTNVPPGSATLPSQILNLTNWKLTLPTGNNESPTEIKQPALSNYTNDPWFLVNAEKNGVRFRAPVNGVTTSGSGYPRSELREMTNNGTANASWSTLDGKVHTMTLEQAITAVPQTKKHVVAGQIHDAGDDVIVIRLEYPKLFIDINGADGPVLDSGYTLGKRFTVKFEVSNGQTRIYYNNSTTPSHTLNKNYSGAYFKAGAYTQSNCESDKEGSALCKSDNYGEVVIYKATVTHQ